jgi:hypothetical protein
MESQRGQKNRVTNISAWHIGHFSGNFCMIPPSKGVLPVESLGKVHFLCYNGVSEIGNENQYS